MCEIQSVDGTRIFINEWLPNNLNVQGIVVIVHGMGEFGERYTPFAQFLTSHSLAVYAPDVRGHGKTAEINNAIRGHLADHEGWNLLISDINVLIEHIRIAHPGLPIYVFGHSMGSLIVRSFTQIYGAKIDGVIHSAASGPMGVIARIGYLIALAEILLIGLHGKSKRMSLLLSGNFNRKIPSARTPFDWLTRDQDEVDRYIADDRIIKSFTAAFYRDMVGGAIDLNKSSNMKKDPATLPMLFLSGEQDPLGNYGKGVTDTCNRYRQLGFNDISLNLYPGARHELLQEHNRTEVMADVWAWISQQLMQHSSLPFNK